MASGVKITDACKASFSSQKMEKQTRYLLYKLSTDMTEVIVEKQAPKACCYEDMLEDLHAAESNGECRYATFDAEYVNDKGVKKEKLIFFAWSPDTAKIKQKMVYAATKDAFKKALGEGIAMEIQANDNGDLVWDEVQKKLAGSDRH